MREGSNGAQRSKWNDYRALNDTQRTEASRPKDSDVPHKRHVIVIITGNQYLFTENHTFSPRASSKPHQYSPTNSTMKIKASTKPKRATSNNGYLFKPFCASWPESAEKIKVKLGIDGTSFSDYFHPLEGTESPELFLLWLQEFQSKVENNTRVASADKLDVLLRIVKGEAKAVVTRTIATTAGTMLANHVENVDFTNQLIQLRTTQFSTKEQWAANLDSEAHPKDVISECIYTLKLLIFGSDMAGKKSYIGLKRQV